MSVGWCDVLHFPEDSVKFATGVVGGKGKGPWCAENVTAHVVDDQLSHLQSCKVFAKSTIRPDGLILFGALYSDVDF